MSLFRALKAKLFPSSQTSRDPKDIHLQTEPQAPSQEQEQTQEPSVAVPLFRRHFSLKSIQQRQTRPLVKKMPTTA